MDYDKITLLAKQAIAENKYLYIKYNGQYRDVYPISFRSGLSGPRMFAWCSLHPDMVSESFTVSYIEDASVSANEALIVPEYVVLEI